MSDTRDADENVGGSVDTTIDTKVDTNVDVMTSTYDDLLQLTRIDAAEQFRASVFEDFRAEYAGYRTAEARAMARVCLAAASARAAHVPRFMAQSQRDYAAAILGVNHSTFCVWAKVGELLCANTHLKDDLIAGRVTLKDLERVASLLGKTSKLEASEESQASEESKASNESDSSDESENSSELGLDAASIEFVSLSIAAPAPAILYIEDSLQIARAQVGLSHGDEDAVSALVTEASTEGRCPVHACVARRRFRVRSDRTSAKRERSEDGPSSRVMAIARQCQLDDSAIARLSAAQLGAEGQRRAAHRIHKILVRLIARRDRLDVRLEDQLFEWALEGLHERMGFHNFERFAEETLGLAASTANDRLSRARLRRREHPVALARRDGRITAVQASLLESLRRKCHVPVSDLDKWITFAVEHTVRRLRTAIAWAWRQVNLDYGKWSLARCHTPDVNQLRTDNQSLEALVQHSGGNELQDALLNWDITPTGVARFHISRETRDELLVQMASMQDEVRGSSEFVAPKFIPGWLAMCRVFHRAREAWRVNHQKVEAKRRRILDRDGYQCIAPECTQRRNLQVHHVNYRGRGGGDEDTNRAALCAFHHQQGEHGVLLRVRGRIQDDGRGLTWEMGLDETGRAQRVYRDERILVRA